MPISKESLQLCVALEKSMYKWGPSQEMIAKAKNKIK